MVKLNQFMMNVKDKSIRQAGMQNQRKRERSRLKWMVRKSPSRAPACRRNRRGIVDPPFFTATHLEGVSQSWARTVGLKSFWVINPLPERESLSAPIYILILASDFFSIGRKAVRLFSTSPIMELEH